MGELLCIFYLLRGLLVPCYFLFPAQQDSLYQNCHHSFCCNLPARTPPALPGALTWSDSKNLFGQSSHRNGFCLAAIPVLCYWNLCRLALAASAGQKELWQQLEPDIKKNLTVRVLLSSFSLLSPKSNIAVSSTDKPEKKQDFALLSFFLRHNLNLLESRNFSALKMGFEYGIS